MSRSTAYAVYSSEICWPLPCAIPRMGPLGWQWGDVGGGIFALKEVTVLVRAGSRWNYNPGLGHSQPAVRYFICPAQRFKQFETPAAGPDIPSCLALLLPYKTSSCLAGAEPITGVICLPPCSWKFAIPRIRYCSQHCTMTEGWTEETKMYRGKEAGGRVSGDLLLTET